MDLKSSQTVMFVPQSLSEAIGWAQSVENYSFQSAFKKAPLLVPLASVKSCRKVRRQGKDFYFLEFELKYQNILVSRSAPVDHTLPIDEVGAVTLLQFMRMFAVADYIKKFYRHSVTTTYVLFLLILIYVLSIVKDWLMDRVMNDHWLVRAGCDVSCAKKMMSIHFGFWLVAFVIALPVAWAPLFYIVNSKFIRQYNYVSALRTEAAILAMTGFLLTVGFLNSNAPSRYSTLISKYRNGTLEFRQPASKANTVTGLPTKATTDRDK